MQKPFQVPEEMMKELDVAIHPQGTAHMQKINPQPADPPLDEREKTHGNYAEMAELAQTLKTAFQSCNGYGNLTLVQRESTEMICTKFARILCGHPDHREHWLDIAGYAMLIAKML
jgi:hypothetical protein